MLSVSVPTHVTRVHPLAVFFFFFFFFSFLFFANQSAKGSENV